MYDYFYIYYLSTCHKDKTFWVILFLQLRGTKEYFKVDLKKNDVFYSIRFSIYLSISLNWSILLKFFLNFTPFVRWTTILINISMSLTLSNGNHLPCMCLVTLSCLWGIHLSLYRFAKKKNVSSFWFSYLLPIERVVYHELFNL